MTTFDATERYRNTLVGMGILPLEVSAEIDLAYVRAGRILPMVLRDLVAGRNSSGNGR